MSDPHAQLDPALQEQLVAYLDGELDADSSRRIEAMLANDPQVRGSLQQLDHTWELLDELDAAPLRENFTQTTLEMVAVAAIADAQGVAAAGPRRRWRRGLLVGAGVLAAAALGFLAVWLLAPDPNRQLLQDLPVLENVDQYRQIDSLDFLRQLAREKLFPEDSEAGNDEEPWAERRQRIAAMSPAQKDQLLRRQQEFQGLDPVEQHRVRQLHEQLLHDPDGAKLRDILGRYCQFLAGLPAYRRAALLELAPAKRLTQIKQLQQEQAKSAARQPNAADRKGLLRWMDHYAQQHESRFLEMLPEARRQQLSRLNAALRQRMVVALMCQRWQSTSPASLAPLSAGDLAELRAEFSPETRRRLEKKTPAEQWQMVAGWIHQEAHRQLVARKGEHSLLPNFDDQLAQFFESLSDEQRDALLSLPGDELQQRLREMYLMQMKAAEPAHPPRAKKPAPHAVKPAVKPAKAEKAKDKNNQKAKDKKPPVAAPPKPAAETAASNHG